MEIPSIKRSQRLGYEQGGAPHDISVAASKGRAIASFGETVSRTAMEFSKFESMAKNAAKSAAVRDAEAEFNIFKAQFNQHVQQNGIDGSKYLEEYEKQYQVFHKNVTDKHSEYASDVSLAVKGLYANNMGNVQVASSKQWSADLINQNNRIAKTHLASIQQNPANYMRGLMDITEGVMKRLDAGEINEKYAQDEIERLSKEATVAAVEGYVMAKNYRAARQFLQDEEVANILGHEMRAEALQKVEEGEFTDYNRQANRADREYNLQMRELEQKQNANFVGLLQTTLHATTPAQVALIEKDIMKQAKDMGISATQAKGLLSQADDQYKEIDGESDFRISQRMANIDNIDQLDKIERDLVKYVSGKQMLADTGTKWFNVIRGMRNQHAVDPRVATMTKAYALRLKGYLPEPHPITGKFENIEQKKRYSIVMSDYQLQVAGGMDPKSAFDYVLKVHRNSLIGSGVGSFSDGAQGEYSPTLGASVKTFDDLNKLMIQIDKNKRSNGYYSNEEIKRQEREAYDLRNMLLLEEDLKKANPSDGLIDNLFTTPASQQLSTPSRRK